MQLERDRCTWKSPSDTARAVCGILRIKHKAILKNGFGIMIYKNLKSLLYTLSISLSQNCFCQVQTGALVKPKKPPETCTAMGWKASPNRSLLG